MKGIVIVVFFIIGIMNAELRTLEIQPGVTIQVPIEHVPKLRYYGLQFLDVTHFPLKSIDKAKENKFPSQIHHKELIESIFTKVDLEFGLQFLEEASKIFTRYYTSAGGQEIVQLVHSHLDGFRKQIPGSSLQFYNDSHNPQSSLVFRIPGKSDERVIVGCHIDSINGPRGTLRAPGADDDGTGMLTLLSILHTGVHFPSVLSSVNRTLEFHFYSAEEVGLLGSQYVAQEYKKMGIPVFSMVQFDMTGYVPPHHSPVIALIRDFTSNELSDYLGLLCDGYMKGGNVTVVNSKCGYGCSDHASWTKVGVDAAFPFETRFGDHNPNIHSDHDDIKYLNHEHLRDFIYLGISYLFELGLPFHQ